MKHLSFYKGIRFKLISSFLVIGLLPLIISGVITSSNTGEALGEASIKQLTGIRDIKKKQIEGFFSERKGDLGVMIETVSTLRREAYSKLKVSQENKAAMLNDYFKMAFSQIDLLSRSEVISNRYDIFAKYHVDTVAHADSQMDVTTSSYSKLWESHGVELNEFIKQTGFYDVFLLCAEHGHVIYSSAKESDLGQNLTRGSLKNSGLAKVWVKTMSTGERSIVDFSPYPPSNGAPAAFLGVPIMGDESIKGVLVVQLSPEHINRIMNRR